MSKDKLDFDLQELQGGMEMNITEILDYLPHRYPFVMVDKVISLKLGDSVIAVKNVSVNEPMFTGHFPDNPVMPGVLMLEALAQATGLLALKTKEAEDGDEDKDDALHYFAGIEKARFINVVRPGDQMMLVINEAKYRRGFWKVTGNVLVDGELCCQAQLSVIRAQAAPAQ